MLWPGFTGPAFPSPNGVGSSTRWGSTGTGVTGSLNTAVGGTGTLSGGLGSTGLGVPGSTRTGLAQTGTSSLGGVGPGLTGFGSAGSSGVGMGKPAVGGAGGGSLGSNTPGFGATLGGTRTPTGGSDVSQGIPSRSGIILHFLIEFDYFYHFLCIFSYSLIFYVWFTAQINLHLKELHRYSHTNWGSEQSPGKNTARTVYNGLKIENLNVMTPQICDVNTKY